MSNKLLVQTGVSVTGQVDTQLRKEAKDRFPGRVTPAVLETIIEEKVKTIANWLSPDVLRQKLEDASLREIAIYEGTMIDKLLAMRGQPSSVVTIQHQQKLDQILPALLQEMQRRGLKATLTERKAEITTTSCP